MHIILSIVFDEEYFMHTFLLMVCNAYHSMRSIVWIVLFAKYCIGSIISTKVLNWNFELGLLTRI